MHVRLDPYTVTAFNTLLGTMLACLMAVLWMRGPKKTYSLLWMSAAWCFAFSCACYFGRAWADFTLTTLLGASLTSLGLLCLLLGTESFQGTRPSWFFAAVILLSHLAAMFCLISMNTPTEGRIILNAVYFGGISSATCLLIRRAPRWRELYGFPALVFGAHALFQFFRGMVAAALMSGVVKFDITVLQSISFGETNLFIVALFISLLLADLKMRNRQLQSALDEVRYLSGLLPICSGCKKIRDDAGYWTKLETYISRHSGAQFSHGLCPECAKIMYPDIFDTKQPSQVLQSAKSHVPPLAN
jgi:hypothetical protein